MGKVEMQDCGITAPLSEQIATFVANLRYEQLPAAVVEKIKTCLFFNLAIASAGHPLVGEVIESVRPFAISNDDDRAARVWVEGLCLFPPDAAFVNGAMMHARSQDDFQHSAHCHIGAAAIPACLALGQWQKRKGRDLIVALAISYQVATALGEENADLVSARGYRPSGLFATIGAAAACSRLLDLDETQTAGAIALAANAACGLNQVWLAGTEEWRLHLGNAARNAVNCALLARAGHGAAPDALEGAAGFFAAHQGVVPKNADVMARLSGEWRTDTVGFKPLPICGINLGPAGNALQIAAQEGLRPDDIQRIEIFLPENEARVAGIAATGPLIGASDAQMRTAFVVATCLVLGKLHYADMVDHDAAALQLAARIDVKGDPSLPPMTHRMRIHTDKGVIERRLSKSPSDYALDRGGARALLHSIDDELFMDDLDQFEDSIWALDREASTADIVSLMIAPAQRSGPGHPY